MDSQHFYAIHYVRTRMHHHRIRITFRRRDLSSRDTGAFSHTRGGSKGTDVPQSPPETYFRFSYYKQNITHLDIYGNTFSALTLLFLISRVPDTTNNVITGQSTSRIPPFSSRKKKQRLIKSRFFIRNRR